MKINLQNFSGVFLIFGFLTFAAVLTAQAQPRLFPPSKPANSSVVFKEKTIPVQITPTDFDSRSGLVLVTGTGAIKVSGTLTTGSGCCARIKVTILRIDVRALANRGGSTPSVSDGSSNTITFSETTGNNSVFKEQTIEMCGSQQINLSENLGANQDDARFLVRIQNIDPWNKTTVGGNLTFRYPTADRILTGQPPIKFDLPQGLEANRAFKLSPNTPGKLKVKVVYNGNTRVKVTLKRPNDSVAATRPTVTSGTEFVYDITEADVAGGDTWVVNVLNLTDTPADDVTVEVTYSVEE